MSLLHVMLMVFCSKCGAKLAEDVYFCPKCGFKTSKGLEAGVSAPSDELKDAMTKMGQELEKAFSVAAKEIQEAFQTARENIRQSFYKEAVLCPKCGGKNPSDSNFCHKCGKKLKD